MKGRSQQGGLSRRDCPLYNMRSKHDNPSRPRERYKQTCSRKYVLRNPDTNPLSLHPPCSGQVKLRYMQASTLIQPTSFFRRGRGDDSSSDCLQTSIALMAFSERVAQDSKPPSAGVTSSSRDVLPSYPETRQVLRLTPILCGQACLAWFGWKSASLAKPDGVSLGSTGDISVAGTAMDGSCARLCRVDNYEQKLSTSFRESRLAIRAHLRWSSVYVAAVFTVMPLVFLLGRIVVVLMVTRQARPNRGRLGCD